MIMPFGKYKTVVAVLAVGGLLVPSCALKGNVDYTPETSDGCTWTPDFDFKPCCVTHDTAYWQGGTEAQRLTADEVFKQCIIDVGHDVVGPLYYTGVRVFGAPHLPTYWRWGFGKDYPTGYEGE